MHHNIESCLNGLPHASTEELPEMAQFLRFREEVMQAKGMEPYRTEWRIAAPDLSLAGSVDCVARLPSGAFVILDWKRSKTLPITGRDSYGKYARLVCSFLRVCGWGGGGGGLKVFNMCLLS